MDIRLLDKNDIEEAKTLWKSAFGDSDEFINTYFKNKILIGNSIGIFDGGLASVVHMIPYKIQVQGRSLESLYIAGAATVKSKRKKGLMKILLRESLELMKARGILMSHLYPFLHSFYEQFGWATYSYVNKRVVIEAKELDNVLLTKDTNLLKAMYQNMTRELDGYVIRSQKEWKWRTDELFSDGGNTAVLLENDIPVCYMMYYSMDDKAEVIETVYEKEEQAQKLAMHLASQFESVEYNLASQNQSSTAHGMARVVDAKMLLREFDAEALLDKVKISDDFADWNNIGSGALELSIGQLARIVHMGFGRAIGKDNIQDADMLNVNINNRFTCIFEEY